MLLNSLIEQFDIAPLSSIFSLPLAERMGRPTILNQSMELEDTNLEEDFAKSKYYSDVVLASRDKIESHPYVSFQGIENHQKNEAVKNIFQPSLEESKNFNDSKKSVFIHERWVQ